MASNYKTPPTLEDTDLPKKKQGLAIYLTLSGKAREAVLELDIEKVNDDSGVDNVLKHLDKLSLQDSNQSAYIGK